MVFSSLCAPYPPPPPPLRGAAVSEVSLQNPFCFVVAVLSALFEAQGRHARIGGRLAVVHTALQVMPYARPLPDVLVRYQWDLRC